MKEFVICNNEYLFSGPVKGYYHEKYFPGEASANDYLGYIHVLKNTFQNKSNQQLTNATTELKNILMWDIKEIIKMNRLNSNLVLIGAPRARKESCYSCNQLLFRRTISIVADLLNVVDGNSFIVRYKDTKTTHIRKKSVMINNVNNDNLVSPYPGITNETCNFDDKEIQNSKIIFLDDVYTKNVNVDEDFIQALYDHGAKEVIFYSCWYTVW